jgi:chromosome segregation ATPase
VSEAVDSRLRIEELQGRIASIVKLVKELAAERGDLREQLETARQRLEEAQNAVDELPELRRRLEAHDREREEIRRSVDGMLSQLDQLELLTGEPDHE